MACQHTYGLTPFEKTIQADSARIGRFWAAFPTGDTATIQDMLHDYL